MIGVALVAIKPFLVSYSMCSSFVEIYVDGVLLTHVFREFWSYLIVRVFRVIPAVTEGIKYSLLRDTKEHQATDIIVILLDTCIPHLKLFYGVRRV